LSEFSLVGLIGTRRLDLLSATITLVDACHIHNHLIHLAQFPPQSESWHMTASEQSMLLPEKEVYTSQEKARFA
jgi:hypothetical protein